MITQETLRTIPFKEIGLPVNVESPANRYIGSYAQALGVQIGEPLPGTTAFEVQKDYVAEIAKRANESDGSFEDASQKLLPLSTHLLFLLSQNSALFQFVQLLKSHLQFIPH